MAIFKDILSIFLNLPPKTIFYLVLLITLRILIGTYGPKIKGFIGEFRVKKQLEKLPTNKYKVLNDILIKDKNNNTVQIDHIVVSIYGIYVIETKYYKGWIHGREYDDYWTQSIFKTKKTFRNPIKQNYGHIQCLKEILSNYSNLPYYSIIVFSGSAELKNVYTKTKVIYSKELIPTISELKFDSILSLEDVENIVSIIKNKNITDKKVRKQHERKIKNRIKKDSKQKSNLKCPNCNGYLIKKNGKYGEFLGCSNFPKCKYTRKL